ncbi:hypothetical protein Godav_009947, partial [Gossypium davidsonii]|nr:hypothetical protein [Gossypium davidsonii]
NKKKLADCAPGFARGTTGRKYGVLYVIVDPIVDELIVTSDKTIDTRGSIWKFTTVLVLWSSLRRTSLSMASISITLVSLRVARSRMVKTTLGKGLPGMEMGSIVLEQPTFGSTIFPFTIAPMVLSILFKVPLPLPFRATISLTTTIDSYAVDEKIEVTVTLNHFRKVLVERMPRCLFGFIHVVNNDNIHLFLYAIGGTSHLTIISQGYRYLMPGTYAAKEVTCKGLLALAQWKSWN